MNKNKTDPVPIPLDAVTDVVPAEAHPSGHALTRTSNACACVLHYIETSGLLYPRTLWMRVNSCWRGYTEKFRILLRHPPDGRSVAHAWRGCKFLLLKGVAHASDPKTLLESAEAGRGYAKFFRV